MISRDKGDSNRVKLYTGSPKVHHHLSLLELDLWHTILHSSMYVKRFKSRVNENIIFIPSS